jgi:hypothetical protein
MDNLSFYGVESEFTFDLLIINTNLFFMKRSLLLLALISFALVFVTPQVNGSDRDVGLSYVLPADNATPVVIDCLACAWSSVHRAQGSGQSH